MHSASLPVALLALTAGCYAVDCSTEVLNGAGFMTVMSDPPLETLDCSTVPTGDVIYLPRRLVTNCAAQYDLQGADNADLTSNMEHDLCGVKIEGEKATSTWWHS